MDGKDKKKKRNWMDGWIIETKIKKKLDGWMDGRDKKKKRTWMDGWMVQTERKRLDGWMDGWMDIFV